MPCLGEGKFLTTQFLYETYANIFPFGIEKGGMDPWKVFTKPSRDFPEGLGLSVGGYKKGLQWVINPMKRFEKNFH